MTLSQLKAGENAIVKKIQTDTITFKRLYSMGLKEGVKITHIVKASFNGPIMVRIQGFYLALRVSVANKIKVEKV